MKTKLIKCISGKRFQGTKTLLSPSYVTFLSGKLVLAAVQENIKVVPQLT